MDSTQHPQTILFVEDEAIIRMDSIGMLEAAGFRVLEAEDSAEALAILADHDEIDVLVTDVRMPEPMDGLALVAQVQRDHPAIRSIVVSSTSSAADARDAGATEFVAKPYQDQVMLRAVRKAMLRN